MTTLSLTPCGVLAGASPAPAGTVPLVLVHAFPLDHRMWEPAAAHLADLPVILVDLPGAGFSPVLAPSLDAAADAVAGSLLDAGYPRWVVGGVSLGGYVAMAVARGHRDRVAGVAFVDTKADADDAATQASRHAIARRVLAEDSPAAVEGMAEVLLGPTSRARQPHLVGEVRRWIAESDAAGIAWAETAMATRPDSHATLRGLEVPTGVIVGEEDQLSPPDVARAMAAEIPDVRLTVIPQAGHLSPVEAPAAVAAALRDVYEAAVPAGGAL
jgi:pimeloyl-ACP methyl ester carboxylesterase